MDGAAEPPGEQGRLAHNVVHFGRVLRAAGLPVGPGKVIDATRAVEAAGIASREDFYWTLHSVFVNRRDQREIFDQAFHVFWRNPRILERMMSLLLPIADRRRRGTRPAEPPAAGRAVSGTRRGGRRRGVR